MKTYTFAEKEFQKRYLVVGKENGCKPSKRLNEFLDIVLEGDFDDQITHITEESNKEDFDAIVAATKAKKTPIIVDMETGKHLAGFKIPKLARFFS